MASADLGGLGSEDGAPVYYDWATPSVLPQVLPWLGILALLVLRPNRCGAAWWVLVPLVLVAGVANVPAMLGELLPSEFEDFMGLVWALVFGLAVVWLLSGYLVWRHRMLAFLGVLVAQAASSALVYMVGHGLEEVRGQTIAMLTALAASALVMAAALTLTGLVCRGRYGWLRVSLWLVAALVVLWLLVIGPFFGVAVISSGGSVPLWAIFPTVGAAVGITFGALLPFLVLSFANGFYRERLKGLLHLGSAEAPPPVIEGTVAGAVEAARV